MHFVLSLSQSEREEFETEFKQKYEREKILLTEENKKLSAELDKVSVLWVKLKKLSKVEKFIKEHITGKM